MDQKVKNLLNDWQISNPALYEIANSGTYGWHNKQQNKMPG